VWVDLRNSKHTCNFDPHCGPDFDFLTHCGPGMCVEFKCVWIGDNTIAMPKTRKLVPLLSEAGVSFLIFDT